MPFHLMWTFQREKNDRRAFQGIEHPIPTVILILINVYIFGSHYTSPKVYFKYEKDYTPARTAVNVGNEICYSNEKGQKIN